jgi:hypothetical protein
LALLISASSVILCFVEKVSNLSFAVSNELDAIGPFRFLINEHFGHLGVEADVNVLPQAHRPEESFGRGAPGASSQGALRHHEAGLLLTVDVPLLVAHFGGRFHKRHHQRGTVGRLLDGHVAAGGVVRRPSEVRVAVILRLFEVVQRVLIVPTGVARALPVIVVVSAIKSCFKYALSLNGLNYLQTVTK